MGSIARFDRVGGPEVLSIVPHDAGDPAAGEVLIAQKAIGVNFADLNMRRGRAPMGQSDGLLGSEAAGVILAVGPDVRHLKPGDRVAYGASRPGSYATERVVPASIVTPLPDSISFSTGAGMMSAGLTAGYLLRRLWPLQSGDPILWTAAAGRVGQLAAQWAAHLGLRVIGTVGSRDKMDAALRAGCAHVVLHDTPGFSREVRALTNGDGVAVAYDGVGAATIEDSIASIRRRGLLVSFGASSGVPGPIDLQELGRRGSLFATRPGLPEYVADPAERASLTAELVDLVAVGAIAVDVAHSYPLESVQEAHRAIEERRTTGSVVLTVE